MTEKPLVIVVGPVDGQVTNDVTVTLKMAAEGIGIAADGHPAFALGKIAQVDIGHQHEMLVDVIGTQIVAQLVELSRGGDLPWICGRAVAAGKLGHGGSANAAQGRQKDEPCPRRQAGENRSCWSHDLRPLSLIASPGRLADKIMQIFFYREP